MCPLDVSQGEDGSLCIHLVTAGWQPCGPMRHWGWDDHGPKVVGVRLPSPGVNWSLYRKKHLFDRSIGKNRPTSGISGLSIYKKDSCLSKFWAEPAWRKLGAVWMQFSILGR